MCWPMNQPNEVVFGAVDGQLRYGSLKSNKFATLYSTDSYVVSCCAGPNGHSFVSGHIDGSIYRYSFPQEGKPQSQALLCRVNFVPYALAWGDKYIVVAGNSPVVKVFDLNGQLIQEFDYSHDDLTKEFTCAAFNRSGQTVVLGNYDRFYVYAWNNSRRNWEEASITTIENLMTVTALRWKSDGSQLVTGSLHGFVDIYDACLRRYIYKGEYELTYTSPSSLVIRRLSNDSRISIVSKVNCEITKVNIYSDSLFDILTYYAFVNYNQIYTYIPLLERGETRRFVVAHTAETLLLADLRHQLVSEIQWNPTSAKERFYFDNECACMIYCAGELSLVEYGKDEILSSCRTEHMSSHLISLCMNEARNAQESDVKTIAYLLDVQTVHVRDLNTGQSMAQFNHDSKIDWLELNQRATKLLFRDKKRCLHLYDIASQNRTTLLSVCNYVQWVPDSDVVAAQSRNSLCVWYSIDNTYDVTSFVIKGDVEDIQRGNGKTEVIIDEGMQKTRLLLDESLIMFGIAIDAGDLNLAVTILEGLSTKSKGVEAMWSQLYALAMQQQHYIIAERCASALGDVSKTKYLNRINQLALSIQQEHIPPSYPNLTTEQQQHHQQQLHSMIADDFRVQAQILMLNKQFKRASSLLLDHGHVDDCINMYRQLHKWSEAINIAQSRNYNNKSSLQNDYYQYLMNTRQEEVAAEFKEQVGDYEEALNLYIRGGYPSKAAHLLLSRGMTHDTILCDKVANALLQMKQYEQAGQFFETLKLYKRALDAYIMGRCYHKAIDLARQSFPSQVVRLEEEYGDWLVSQKQMDAACNHYREAGAYLKAINAAIEAKQGNKAAQILDMLEGESAKPFYPRVAQYCQEQKKWTEAEKYYLQGGMPQEVVKMYTNMGMWDKAHSIAMSYMASDEVNSLYVNQGQKLESQGKLKEAERLYLTVDQADVAISMYKKNRQYDEMIRLVSQHRKDLLNDTHLHLARQFETEGNLKVAESHYLKAKEWRPAVNMYKTHEMWEDVLRIAKSHGGSDAYKYWAFEVARIAGGDAGIKLLIKFGLAELAVDYAIEKTEYQTAFSICEKACKHKTAGVHYHLAMSLEDEGRFIRAEEEFIKAKKPKEAVDMYIHQQEWDNAMRIAQQHDPASMIDVYDAHAKYQHEHKNYSLAEQLYLAAKKPELTIKMYTDVGMWDDCIRVAKVHVPRMVSQLQNDRIVALQNSSQAETLEFLVSQAKLLVQNKSYSQAIDIYLKINQQHTEDQEVLERIWDNAINLAMDFVKHRLTDVVDTVSSRLCSLQRYEQAADIYMSIEQFKSAIDILIQAKMYDKAKEIAQQFAPQYESYVSQLYQDFLVRNGRMNQLGQINPDMAIDILIQRGDWQQVYDLAAKQGEGVVQKYTAVHATQLLKDDQANTALLLFIKNGAPVVPANFPIYKRMAQQILRVVDVNDNGFQHYQESIMQLRDFLMKIVLQLLEIDPHSPNTKDLERLLFICHYSCMKSVCQLMTLNAQSTKCCVSLLRYTNDLPVDKAFYEAGLACKNQNWLNLAFVFWNRYVDLSDVITEPESGDIDNTDFLISDIPSPFDLTLPKRASLPSHIHEEVREWVLDQAMADSGQSLSTRVCEKCNEETYEAALTCHNCSHVYLPCIITGYPVLSKTKVSCKGCGRWANKEDWNKYVSRMKTCPWCTQSANPIY